MKRVRDPLDPEADLLMVTSEEWRELKAGRERIAKLERVRKAAWDFKMAVYMARMPDGELAIEWLKRSTANIRAASPELQVGPAHDRFIAALAALDSKPALSAVLGRGESDTQ